MRLCLLLAGTGVVGGAQELDVAAAARAAIDAMNAAFYDPTQGRWSPADPWWLNGVALTSLVDYVRKTGSREYMGQVDRVVQVQRAPLPWWPQGGGDFRADSTDDTAWWALAMVRMFDLTGDRAYLDIAARDEAYIHQFWTDAECSGGVWVDIRARTYKNAIANELYIKLAASLYNRHKGGPTTPDAAAPEQYLARAERAWSWLRQSGMINGENLFNDGLAMDEAGVCFNNNLPVWTYNQGVILGGLAGAHSKPSRFLSPFPLLFSKPFPAPHIIKTELYLATSNASYLAAARGIADAVLASPSLTAPGSGTLTEPCERQQSCNVDQQLFKGIFAANLAELVSALSSASASAPVPGSAPPATVDDDGQQQQQQPQQQPQGRYRAYLEHNAASAYARARGWGDLYDVGWAGPFAGTSLSKQASAVGLLVALI